MQSRGAFILVLSVVGAGMAGAIGCGGSGDSGQGSNATTAGEPGTGASGGTKPDLDVGGSVGKGGTMTDAGGTGDAGAGNVNNTLDQCAGTVCANHTGSETFVEDGATSDAADVFGNAASQAPGSDALREPFIIYPSHETMFPINVSHIRHEWAAGDNDLFELTFEGPSTTVKVYTAQTNWKPTDEEWDWIAESNRGGAVKFSVRGLDSAKPGNAYETEAITLYFSSAEVQGAIYYWSTGTKGIMKALVSDPVPVKFYTDPMATDAETCVACHTLSRDGKRLSVGYGGEKLREVSVPDRATIVPAPKEMARSSGWTTFSPDGKLLLVANAGVLTLIDSDTGAPVGPNKGVVPLPQGKFATHPDWSALGDKVALALAAKAGNKDVQGASIAVLPYDNGTWGAPTVIAPSAGKNDNNYFPVWSPDSKYIAYVNAQGTSKDAITARLKLLKVSDNSVQELTRTNERVNNHDATLKIGNSMPTWAPSTKPGTFWIAFSSLRAYASVRPQDGNEDQIWIAAIDPTQQDPGYSGFWAPFQSVDAGNHRAFWTHTGEDSQCLCQEICGDSLDNDCDGSADETDCIVKCGDVEICGDKIDNNCDCIIDDCTTEDCGDQVDNDGDDLVDAADPDCMQKCDPKEDCSDGIDNDCDGLVDERDSDCIVK